MKIAIYGAGNCGEYIIREIKEAKKSNIEAMLFIDNNPIYKDKDKYGIPIVDLEGFIKCYCKTVEAVLKKPSYICMPLLSVFLKGQDFRHLPVVFPVFFLKGVQEP